MVFFMEKYKGTYEAYRKSGYSRKFLEEHYEKITVHKAAKAAFNELEVKQIPRMKDLNVQYAEILTVKKPEYAEYRKLKYEIPEYLMAQKNITALYEAERGADKNKIKERER